ncbi:hypothetical protein [Radiobacillus sp. PE A8.2]|uniref:hypothetical protein n=1 Tax=Radiobacillus sp. PE A8.2 TaxID=3380349 RepID=UPI00388E731A
MGNCWAWWFGAIISSCGAIIRWCGAITRPYGAIIPFSGAIIPNCGAIVPPASPSNLQKYQSWNQFLLI